MTTWNVSEQCTVVLGGGGVRGIAHVGVLRALEERGVAIGEVIGTSIGAIVGAAFCAGVRCDALAERAARFSRDDIVTINRWALLLNGIRQTSVFTGERLRAFIEEVVPEADWSELTTPLAVNAVDAQTADIEWFGAGGRTDVTLHDAVYASSALPLYYPPAEFDGRYYFDGGILDPLPIARAIARGAERIVAVDLSTELNENAAAEISKGLVGVHHRVLSVLRAHARRQETAGGFDVPVLLIRPNLAAYGTWDFDKAGVFLEEGYRAAAAALDDAIPLRA
ncbi:MAG TPA: patatin-like phospholipase family protein [Longimicrobiales bacterium]